MSASSDRLAQHLGAVAAAEIASLTDRLAAATAPPSEVEVEAAAQAVRDWEDRGNMPGLSRPEDRLNAIMVAALTAFLQARQQERKG